MDRIWASDPLEVVQETTDLTERHLDQVGLPEHVMLRLD